MKEYTDEQKSIFVERAQEVGIGRAIRELGYPSWAGGQKWCKARNVEPNTDTIMAAVKKYHTFYETSDALLIAEEGFERVLEKLTEGELDADALKKVSEAYQKFANTWQVLQGKASNITENVKKDGVDLELVDLLNREIAKNNVTSRDLEPRSSEA